MEMNRAGSAHPKYNISLEDSTALRSCTQSHIQDTLLGQGVAAIIFLQVRVIQVTSVTVLR